MGIGARFIRTLIGEPVQLPAELVQRYPELMQASYRRGGLAVRIGGWSLGTSTAAAITLWRTVYVSPRAPLTAELLLHELRHVHQFLESWTFPFSYLWQSIRYGYTRNAYEVDARRYSAARLNAANKES